MRIDLPPWCHRRLFARGQPCGEGTQGHEHVPQRPAYIGERTRSIGVVQRPVGGVAVCYHDQGQAERQEAYGGSSVLAGSRGEDYQAGDHDDVHQRVGCGNGLRKRRLGSLLHDRPEKEIPAEGDCSRHDHQSIERDARARCDWNRRDGSSRMPSSRKGVEHSNNRYRRWRAAVAAGPTPTHNK